MAEKQYTRQAQEALNMARKIAAGPRSRPIAVLLFLCTPVHIFLRYVLY